MAFECRLLPDAGYADHILGQGRFLHNIFIGDDEEKGEEYFLSGR